MMKSKKSKLVVALLALGVILSASQAPAFGLGNLVSAVGGGSTSANAGDPDAFLKSAQTAEALMGNSVNMLVRSLVSKEKVAEIEAAKKAASAVTDAAEKQAKLTEVRTNSIALLNERMSNENFKSDIEKMDGRQKEELGASAFNFMLAMLQDKALVEQSKGLITSISANPMNVGKLGMLKDTASSLSNQLSSAAQIAGKMPSIFSAVGVKAPTSKDEKEKKVAQVSGE